MTETTTPLESGLAWTVDFANGRAFVGRAALEAQLAAGVPRRLVGLLLEDKGVLRAHQLVLAGARHRRDTSGGYAPTLERSIALARVPQALPGGGAGGYRGKALRARLVKAPFVRHGRAQIEL